MTRLIHLNGQLVDAAGARVGVFDRGLLYGDGIFETMRAYSGRVHLLWRHLRRLEEGARFLGIPLPSLDDLAGAVRSLIKANDVADAILRLTVTRGTGENLEPSEPEAEPTIIITHKPLLHTGDIPRVEQLITVRPLHSPPPLGMRLKSLNYLSAVVASRELRSSGAGEGMVLTREGIVAEGTVSSLFSVHGDVLWTPPLELGILPGITRGRVLELAGAMGIEVREEAFNRAALLAGTECFYTNSARELVAASSIDGVAVGSGAPGPVTLALLNAYRAGIPDENL